MLCHFHVLGRKDIQHKKLEEQSCVAGAPLNVCIAASRHVRSTVDVDDC